MVFSSMLDTLKYRKASLFCKSKVKGQKKIIKNSWFCYFADCCENDVPHRQSYKYILILNFINLS